MKKEVEIKYGRLVFDIDERGICFLYALSSGMEKYLGLELDKILAVRMSDALSKLHGKKPFEHNGTEMRTLVNMQDPISTLAYSFADDGDIMLYTDRERRNAEDKPIFKPVIRLCREDIASLISELESMANLSYEDRETYRLRTDI